MASNITADNQLDVFNAIVYQVRLRTRWRSYDEEPRLLKHAHASRFTRT
jgi:hypothetical protein